MDTHAQQIMRLEYQTACFYEIRSVVEKLLDLTEEHHHLTNTTISDECDKDEIWRWITDTWERVTEDYQR